MKDNKLYSYETETKEKLTEIIDLLNCKGVEEIFKRNKNGSGFNIILKNNKKRTFIASSEYDRDRWVQYIKEDLNVIAERKEEVKQETEVESGIG